MKVQIIPQQRRRREMDVLEIPFGFPYLLLAVAEFQCPKGAGCQSCRHNIKRVHLHEWLRFED